MPGRRSRKSVCQERRRFSPSVTAFSPTASCLRIKAAMSRSSIAASCSAVISPRARLSRASFSAGERSRLPTWSARNGGLVRCIAARPTLDNGDSSPNFVGQFHDHPQLRPLLVLGQNVALLGGGKAPLRRQAKLVERNV